MGAFVTVLNQQSFGPIETNCKQLQPVIIATLHDIDENLKKLGVYKSGAFEVNQETINLFCHQNASLTLLGKRGVKLLLVKLPVQRAVPPGASPAYIRTDIRINATVLPPGAAPPTNPTTYGEELIPNRYLNFPLEDLD